MGATGGTGRHLVTQALERDFAVTALVRDPSRLQVEHPRLTVVQGDVLDYGSVDAAMRGQEAVLSALGDKQGGIRHGHGIGSFVRTVRISRADVADFMLNQLASDPYLQTAPGVCR